MGTTFFEDYHAFIEAEKNLDLDDIFDYLMVDNDINYRTLIGEGVDFLRTKNNGILTISYEFKDYSIIHVQDEDYCSGEGKTFETDEYSLVNCLKCALDNYIKDRQKKF